MGENRIRKTPKNNRNAKTMEMQNRKLPTGKQNICGDKETHNNTTQGTLHTSP